MSIIVAQSARKYLGLPFRHMARGPRYLDCAGLVFCSFRDIGVQLKDLPYYGRQPFKDGLRSIVEENFGLPRSGPLLVGDVLLMKFSTEPHHLGIVGDYVHGGFSLIHADGTKKKVVEHRLDDTWASRIIFFYRWDFS